MLRKLPLLIGALAVSTPATGQEITGALSFSLDHYDVTLNWAPQEGWALQRSTTLVPHHWETLWSTIGAGTFTDIRRLEPSFYRLVCLSGITPEADKASVPALETRMTAWVVNQIQRATDPVLARQGSLGETPPDSGNASFGVNAFGQHTPYSWASQPGLIRTYVPGKNGFHLAFKLYSSGDSIASSAGELDADVARLIDWQSSPSHYTDLNAPEPDSEEYPIIDPRAFGSGTEGFTYQVDAEIGLVPNERLPMPAEWLYVLNDGSLGVLDEDGRWTGEGDVSVSNPIAARIAYWTDDETCKLNINVASECIPWDLPRADTPQERDYARNQPVSQEIQRYPGHPATTSLSSILYPGKAANHPDPSKCLTNDELATIFTLTPRATHRGSSTPLTFDDDPLYVHEDDWRRHAESLGIRHAAYLKGFQTTSNPSPETTIHGTPRMSIWPIHEGGTTRVSAYDERSEFLTRAGNNRQFFYHFRRRDHTSRHGELYSRAFRGNIRLYDTLMHLTHQKLPGYGQALASKSLAAKYGASLKEEDYRDDTDYSKDHYAIALSIFDRIRTSNLFDPSVRSPYADDSVGSNGGHGAVPGLNLIGRHLGADNGSAQHSARWFRPTLEPQGTGRGFTLSELALVIYATAAVRISDWGATGARFADAEGDVRSVRVLQSILSNEHPGYAKWHEPFTAEDVGKTYLAMEVGLIPEIFCPTQGFPRLRPEQTLRLLTDGNGYLGGVSEETAMRINGIPLTLWGKSIDTPTFGGPAIYTTPAQAPGFPFPADWLGMLGGFGGMRLHQFGDFFVGPEDEGYFGAEFLPNGEFGTHWHCQTVVVAEAGHPLQMTQDAPLQVTMYHQSIHGATTGNITKLFHFRFTQPGDTLSLPSPTLAEPGPYRDWPDRFLSAVNHGRQNSLTNPEGMEVIRSLTLSHGDYRHSAMKRSLPSELFTSPTHDTSMRAAHALTWDGRGGTGVEATASQGPNLHERSLVAGVDYASEALPDFVNTPFDRKRFAPLLADDYQFPIDPTITRDFDNGFGNMPDGPLLNYDDGEAEIPLAEDGSQRTPYFDIEPVEEFHRGGISAAHHFARRILPSPVVFGSIPSASQANAPWTCLLFRPNISDPTRYPHLGERGNGMIETGIRSTQEGFEIRQMGSIQDDLTLPPDHQWLDYFWMPTAEPVHAASPFATQGKVNLNYQLFPYTYITRATALHALLKAEEIMAIPTDAGQSYKTSSDNPNWRHRIDAHETLKQFEKRFADGEIFMTESEICEQFLIPEGQQWDPSGSSIRQFWDRHRLTGDNTLERPYAGLYSRVTTRSNAFRLHFHIQTITKGADSSPDRFDPDQDVITEDRRGTKVIERVLNPSQMPTYIVASRLSSNPRIERFYDMIVREVD